MAAVGERQPERINAGVHLRASKTKVDSMIDIGSISSLAGSLKAASDIAQAMIGLRDAQTFQAKVIELNREIMAAQSGALGAYAAQTAMIEELGKLKAQIAALEAWDREKERYQLTDHGGGTFTYALKPGMEQGEPFHRICAQCYQQRRKGFLQSKGDFHGREKVTCDSCDRTILLGVGHAPAVQSVNPNRRKPYHPFR